MKTKQNNQKEYLDILFEGKNKLYGSYELRTNYTKRVKKAIIISSIFAFSIFGFIAQSKEDIVKPKTNGGNMIPITIMHRPPAKPIEKPKEVATKPAAKLIAKNTIKAPTIKVVQDVDVKNIKTKTPKEELTKVTSSEENNNNNTNLGIDIINGNSGTGTTTGSLTGSGNEPSNGSDTTTQNPTPSPKEDPKPETPKEEPKKPETPKEEPEPIKNVPEILEADALDMEPEFPGGMDALKTFLEKNIEYPEDAVIKEREGTVKVNFVIDEEGKISMVSTDSKLGLGLEKEATRVVKIMPNWKPGKWQGKAVKCYFTVPISFHLDD